MNIRNRLREFIFATGLLLLSTSSFSLGRIDVAQPGHYAGWACKQGSSELVKIRIIRDDGVLLSTSTSNKLREGAVKTACSSTHANHGFDVLVALSGLITNKVHAVNVYAVYANGTVSPLSNSPVRIAFGTPSAQPERPIKVGAIVGRSFSQLGHLGIWDGSRVVEVMNDGPTANNVEQNTWDDFLKRTTPWSPLYPRYSTYTLANCFQSSCRITTKGTQTILENSNSVQVVEALVRRALQIKAIGASYTLTGSAATAIPSRIYKDCDSRGNGCEIDKYPSIRGRYRCDTFIMDLFRNTVSSTWDFSELTPIYKKTSLTQSWKSKVNELSIGATTPINLYARIRIL